MLNYAKRNLKKAVFEQKIKIWLYAGKQMFGRVRHLFMNTGLTENNQDFLLILLYFYLLSMHKTFDCRCPIDPFTNLDPQNPSLKVPKLHKVRQSPDPEALKLGKGR